MPSLANYISLYALRSRNTINGNFRVITEETSQIPFAGNTWTYQQNTSSGAESIYTKGPIDEDITIYLLANQEYDGVNFTFNPLKTSLGGFKENLYFWNYTEWEECDVAACGHGQQSRGVVCLKLLPGGSVEEVEGECDFLKKLDTRRECGMEPCHYTWVESEWNRCNVSCDTGTQTRDVACHLEEEVVDDKFCSSELRPLDVRTCHKRACHYEWQHGEWGECLCAAGEGGCGWMERDVWCVKVGEHGDVTVGEELCRDEGKPERSVSCHTPQPCTTWVVSDWSEVCSMYS